MLKKLRQIQMKFQILNESVTTNAGLQSIDELVTEKTAEESGVEDENGGIDIRTEIEKAYRIKSFSEALRSVAGLEDFSQRISSESMRKKVLELSTMMKIFVILGFIALSSATIVSEDFVEDRTVRYPKTWIIIEHTPDDIEIEEPESHIRSRRSFQPGAPSFPMPGSNLPTSITSNVEKQGDNTITTLNAQHKTDRYDVGATWSKVVRGPAKSKPNWSIGGTYRW
ncbi:coleoptericin [Holotrichia oblita]|uniref:Coleoptericin n=1 Tax=Holotrichia oblita TaxID=644536 RepID=A0ACB9TQW7_HOLOL|nr:coleoptericin [Holotrichia oblita]